MARGARPSSGEIIDTNLAPAAACLDLAQIHLSCGSSEEAANVLLAAAERFRGAGKVEAAVLDQADKLDQQALRLLREQPGTAQAATVVSKTAAALKRACDMVGTRSGTDGATACGRAT